MSQYSNYKAFLAFLAGGLVGGTIALLYAPQSGSDTRKKIVDSGQKVKDSALESIQNVRDSAEAAIKDMQTRMDLMTQETKDYIERLKNVDPNASDGHKVGEKATA